MAYKVFCDTNIIIDFLVDDRPNHTMALQFFAAVQNGMASCFISETVLTSLAYVLRKLEPKDLLRQHMQALLFYFEVLPNNTKVCQMALQSVFADIEDAILYHIALHHGLDYFVTENLRDFKTGTQSQLPVCSTAQFLGILK